MFIITIAFSDWTTMVFTIAHIAEQELEPDDEPHYIMFD